jgi:hypothetical protein
MDVVFRYLDELIEKKAEPQQQESIDHSSDDL